MNSYEALFIFAPDLTPDARKAQYKTLDDLLTKYQAEVLQKTEWGKRPLGYTVRKFSEGHILIVDYKMPPSKATEFRKALELQEDIFKFMITARDLEAEKKAAKAAAAAAAKAAAPAAAPAAPAARTTAPSTAAPSAS